MRAHLHEAGGQVEAADDERATDREWGPVPEEELLLFVHTGNEGDNQTVLDYIEGILESSYPSVPVWHVPSQSIPKDDLERETLYWQWKEKEGAEWRQNVNVTIWEQLAFASSS